MSMFGQDGMSMMLANALKAALGPERIADIEARFEKIFQFAEHIFNGVNAIQQRQNAAEELAAARHAQVIAMFKALGVEPTGAGDARTETRQITN